MEEGDDGFESELKDGPTKIEHELNGLRQWDPHIKITYYIKI